MDAGFNPPPFTQYSCKTVSLDAGTALRFTP
jgi:hypothetical protein